MSRWLLLLLTFTCVITTGLVGCQSSPTTGDDESWLSPVAKQFLPPSAGQLARDAFDVYDADKRRNAVAQLSAASFGGEEPYVRMYRLLLSDPDASVRAASIKALGLHGAPEDVSALIAGLDDPAGFVRWETALTLQKLHHPDAVAPLLKAMAQDTEPDVRMAAARALGQYAERRVYDGLVGALDDADFGVVEAAHDSLVTLTGYDFGSDASLWVVWAQRREGQVFTHQQLYLWQPFVEPRTFWRRIQFWRSTEPPAPRMPTGLQVSSIAG